jgi:hypothetical protein
MRKDIFLAVPAAGLLFFGASALLLALTDPALGHWYFAFWVGVICTPLGVANLIMLLVWEMSDPIKRQARAKLGPALLINFGICLSVIGAVWYFAPTPYMSLVDLAKQLGKNASNREQVFEALTSKWTQLIEASTATGRPADRPIIDEQMRQAFAAVSGNVEARKIFGPSPSLIVLLSYNTFLVLNPVVMRAAPNLIFPKLPTGVQANIIGNSPVGFTVIFTPPTIAITTLPTVFASAEL